jgi:heme/copper-type cytochrome/quinol oxidase subunit 2
MGGAPPNNWLVPAILSIFCCWPLAIPAIIFATKVNAQWNIGDYAGADDAAKKAKMFSLIGIIVGVVWYVVVALFYIFVFAAAATSASYSTY